MSDIKPGIYFDMSEEEYHAAPALSASGIKNLLVSPLTYWINSPFNPDYEDEKTAAMALGTAFHRRLLEPERFAEIYGATPTKDDYPSALSGAEALREECQRLGIKKSGRIEELCDRILEANPRAQLWPVIEQGLKDSLEGKTLLKRSDMDDIERAARIVFAHQSAAKALTGGHPEVSIFWTDPEYGVLMKSRVDYLKVQAIIDIKSFANSQNKPINTAIANTVANYGYHVQAAVYHDAVQAAKAMLRKHKAKALHGADDIANDWLVHFAACERHAFVFVFIETGKATNVRVREFRPMETYNGLGGTTNAYWMAGKDGYRLGVRRFAKCMAKHGPDNPWIEDEPMLAFQDTDFPVWMMG